MFMFATSVSNVYCEIITCFFLFTFNERDMSHERRTESHEQLFFACELGTADEESAVVNGTSCCVILECLVTSIACIT